MPQSYDFAITAEDLSGPAWQSLKRQAREASDQVAAMNDPLKGLLGIAQQARAAFAAFIGSEVVARFVEFNNQVKEATALMARQSDALGITTDALQAYQMAARHSQTSTDDMQSILAVFNGKIGAATQGNKQAIEAFNQLGVKILDAHGNLRPFTDIVTETSRALLAESDSSVRAALTKELFGRAAQQATPLLRELAQGVNTLDAASRQAGTTISAETIEAFKKLKEQSEQTAAQIRTMYAEFAAPIELKALRTVTDWIAQFRNHVKQAQLDWKDFAAAIVLGPAAGPVYLATRKSPFAKAQEEAAGIQGQIDRNQGIIDTTPDARIKARRQRENDNLRQQLQDAQQRAAGFAGPNINDMIGPPTPPPDVVFGGTKNPPITGAGKRDRIGEELTQLQAQTAASIDAFNRLRDAAKSSIPLADLEREVNLQKQIADELAKIGKYDKNDPRLPQIKALVAEHEIYNTKLKELEEALKTADQTERQYGDGHLAFLETQKKLNDALATSRLSQDAYTLAMKQASEQAEQTRLKNLGLQGGVTGLMAGWQAATDQYNKSNEAFQQGQQLFQNTLNLMDQGLSQFVSKGKVNFESLLTSFLSMVAQMELKAATSTVFNALGLNGGSSGGGAAGGLVSWLTGLFGSNSNAGGYATVGSGAGSTNGVPNFTGMAAGGSPPVGMPTLVGESGPELFVPNSSGQILSNKDIRGGGSNGVTIHQSLIFGSDVDRGWLENRLARHRDETVAAVLAAKRQGGRRMAAAFG